MPKNGRGPRGRTPLSDEERNRHWNLILLCGDHHKLVDSQLTTYSVPVLFQMKADHERCIRAATAPSPDSNPPILRAETIHSTLVTVTHLPEVVFSAPCSFNDDQSDHAKERLNYPSRWEELVPFVLRERKLFAFHDLRDSNNPFSSVIDNRRVERLRASELWTDAEGKRRYTTLLNRSLYKYPARLGIQYDPLHYRFYFPVETKGQERSVTYRPLNASTADRQVAWRPKSKQTGLPKSFWWHLAAGLRFTQMANQQWCFSIRPERHVTQDGEVPLPSQQIGRKVTRLKARMFNDLYLTEVNFWRDYLSQGRPRFVFDFGNQSAVVDSQLLTFEVMWPGIAGDERPFKNQAYQEDLFTMASFTEATSGERIDWDDEEEDNQEEETDQEELDVKH